MHMTDSCFCRVVVTGQGEYGLRVRAQDATSGAELVCLDVTFELVPPVSGCEPACQLCLTCSWHASRPVQHAAALVLNQASHCTLPAAGLEPGQPPAVVAAGLAWAGGPLVETTRGKLPQGAT
jgi:hypothetical protein